MRKIIDLKLESVKICDAKRRIGNKSEEFQENKEIPLKTIKIVL